MELDVRITVRKDAYAKVAEHSVTTSFSDERLAEDNVRAYVRQCQSEVLSQLDEIEAAARKAARELEEKFA